MAQTIDRHTELEKNAKEDPYAHMDSEDWEYVATEMDIMPVDATKHDKLANSMSFAEKNIGLGNSVLCVTDYGRHRDECDTLGDFVDFIREKMEDSIPSQYTKLMDDDKEIVAEELIAVTRSNGYIVIPRLEE